MPKKRAKPKRKRKRSLSPEVLAKYRANALKARETYRAMRASEARPEVGRTDRPKTAEQRPRQQAEPSEINAPVKDWRGETISVGDTVVCPGQRGGALFLTEGVVTHIRRRTKDRRKFIVFDVLQTPATPDGTAKRVSVWTSWITKVAPCNNSEQCASDDRISKGTKVSSFAERHWPDDEWSHAAFCGKHLITAPNYEVEAVRVYEGL
jgi:hypothetical protein